MHGTFTTTVQEFCGARFSYRQSGYGDPVLLLHASASTGGSWRGVIGELGGAFSFYTPDLAGYGQSACEYLESKATLRAEAEFVAPLLWEAKEPFHVIGHSFGGAVAAARIARNSTASSRLRAKWNAPSPRGKKAAQCRALSTSGANPAPGTGCPRRGRKISADSRKKLSATFIQHSVMARPGFKKWWTRIVPESIERSTYVLAATLALALILWQWRPMPAVVWHMSNPALAAAVIGLSLFGWFLVLLATFVISHFELFGLHQVIVNLMGKKMSAASVQNALAL